MSEKVDEFHSEDMISASQQFDIQLGSTIGEVKINGIKKKRMYDIIEVFRWENTVLRLSKQG